MKRKLQYLVMVMMLISVLVSPASASAQMSVPDQLQYLDAQVTVFSSHLVGFQAGYLAAHGQYFQALESHSYAPDTITPPDGLDTRPTYQNETLAVLWNAAALPWELGWSFSIDTYAGADGQGYVLNIQTVLDGKEYRKSINYGPENYRAADWYEFIPWE
jgi:hypothetical protein